MKLFVELIVKVLERKLKRYERLIDRWIVNGEK